MKQMTMTKKEFIIYCGEFYGPNSDLYPMGATPEIISKATTILLRRFGTNNVDFDSLDRERVRDIMIEKFGLVFPTPA
jgi:hypothetical protein